MKPISTLIALFILTTFLPSSTLAQSSSDPWFQPLNLSHSGAATDPIMGIDGDGVIHVFWTDEFDGPMYTRGDNEEWSPPVPVSVPFEGYIPLLLADSGGYLHAFWIDENHVLYYASVDAEVIPISGWSSAEILAGSAVAFNVEIDDQDRFHIAYVRVADTSEGPAGVYYRQSDPHGSGWSAPSVLYQSPYFRKLSQVDAHVDVEVSYVNAAQQEYVTWDNRPQGRVFLTKSSDGGLHWGEPQEIDKPAAGEGPATPSDLSVFAQGEKVLLFWQRESLQTACAQYYRWSLDAGETWQPSQHLSPNFFNCPEQTKIMKGQDGPILLFISSEAYLQAWDGTRWSDPQVQSQVVRMIDPQIQQTVDLGCHQTALVGLELFVLGCDVDKEGDIYLLRRSMSDSAAWFPQESLWKPITSVTRDDSPFLSLAMVADTEDRIHLLWSQGTGNSTGSPDSALYYSRWEGERLWSRPAGILASPSEPVDQPAVALGPTGRLLAVWRRGDQGEIAFSQATASQAALPSSWSEPERISAPGQLSISPDILVSQTGEIYVAYAVPVNEGRGIYLTHSEDGGQTWSDPTQVFDAASAGWVMLDQPGLALTGNGDLHLLWTRYALRSNRPEPLALFYARSQDGGKTRTAPETVVENPVAWSRILGVGDQTVYRFWQEPTAGQTTTLWHERSLDNGQTWERIAPISIFGEAVGRPSLAWDGIGELHLLQVVSRGIGKYALLHWIWDGERWGSGGNLNLDLEQGTIINDLASAISPQGHLSVVLSASVLGQDLQLQGDELLFTERSLELREGQPTPLPPASVAPVVTSLPEMEPTVQPTLIPTPDLAELRAIGSGSTSSSSWNGLIFGGLLAGIIVSIVLGVGLWKVRKF